MEFQKLKVDSAQAEANVWAMAAAADLGREGQGNAELAAQAADKLLAEFRKRFIVKTVDE